MPFPWDVLIPIALDRITNRSPGSRFRDVVVRADGSVDVTARIARGISQRTIAEWVARAERELTAWVQQGTAPSQFVLDLLSDRQRAHVERALSQFPLPPPDFVEPLPGQPGQSTKSPRRPGVRDEKLPPADTEDSPGAIFGSDALIEGGRQLSPPGPEFFMPRSIPGGAFGMAQQAPATLARVRSALGGGGTKRKRSSRGRPRNVGRPRTRRKPRKTGKRRTKLVKGSAAAKRFMANLRKKRK